MQPHVFSYLHSWTPAGVDRANTGQLPSTEEQSGQTQVGCYQGPAAVTSFPNTSPEACARREALRSLGHWEPWRCKLGIGVPCQGPRRVRKDWVGLKVDFWSLNLCVPSFLSFLLPG